jgi:uncharacterized SAM-binding protein YcdF (DUF218 family)
VKVAIVTFREGPATANPRSKHCEAVVRGLIAFTVCATAVAVGATLLRLRRAGRSLPPRPGDVILVFGAVVWPTGPSPALRARSEHAARLYREGFAPAVLCGGTPVETDAMHTLLRNAGVPKQAILSEPATSTRDTVTAAIRCGGHDWGRVLAVSSHYHMHRVLAEARRQGLPVSACPVPPATNGTRTPYEVAAIWWYAISSRFARR